MAKDQNLDRDVGVWLVTVDLFVLLVCVLIWIAWIAMALAESNPSVCLRAADRWVDWVHKPILWWIRLISPCRDSCWVQRIAR